MTAHSSFEGLTKLPRVGYTRKLFRRSKKDRQFHKQTTARLVVNLPDYLDALEVLAHHGIKKRPHACLLAGPVTYKGMPLPTEPYIGVAPEMAPHLGVSRAPRWILTIENMASFNRQVREAAEGGVVVYTGGFPSNSTLGTILVLARATTCPVLHWGDIDGGGIKIAYLIERALAAEGRRLNLHLMTPELAMSHGSPEKPSSVLRSFDDGGSCVAGLVAFMASHKAHSLEQEELDPVIPTPTTWSFRHSSCAPRRAT